MKVKPGYVFLINNRVWIVTAVEGDNIWSIDKEGYSSIDGIEDYILSGAKLTKTYNNWIEAVNKEFKQ